MERSPRSNVTSCIPGTRCSDTDRQTIARWQKAGTLRSVGQITLSSCGTEINSLYMNSEISYFSFISPGGRGGSRVVTKRGVRCGGRGQGRCEKRSQGELRFVSGRQSRKTNDPWRGRQKRVVPTVVATVKLCGRDITQPGLMVAANSRSDGDKRNSSPRRARYTS